MSTTTKVAFDDQTYLEENTSEIPIGTVAEFHEQLGTLGTKDEPTFLYRGQSDVEWAVDCSAVRRLTNSSANPVDDQLMDFLLVSYLEFLIANAKTRDLIPPGLGENSTDLEFLAQLQHQGAATGLIDFTRRPLVALWFACKATREEDRKADGAVYVLSRSETQAVSKRDFEDKTIRDFYNKDKLRLWEPSAIGQRTVAQGSVFVFGVPRIHPTQMKRLIVQAAGKAGILKELETLYGIDEEELVADFSGYAAAHTSTRIFDVTRTYAEAYNTRGVAHNEKGEFDLAMTDFNKAIELDPDFAKAYINRGAIYIEKGAFDLAIPDFDKAIELDPDDVAAYSNRGTAYANTGRFDLAVQDLHKAVELKPDDANEYASRGTAYIGTGEFDLAIRDLDKAIELDPNLAKAHFMRGSTHMKKGDPDLAIQDLDKAIELDPDDAISYANRGFAHVKKGELDLAIQDFDKAIELNPSDANAYNSRGVVHINKGDPDLAIRDLDKAIALNPNFAEAHYIRGMVHRAKGDLEQAAQDFGKAIELNPDAVAYYNRGRTWLLLGEWERAKADLTAVKNMGTDIAGLFRTDHESVAEFERRYNIRLPADIAVLLT